MRSLTAKAWIWHEQTSRWPEDCHLGITNTTRWLVRVNQLPDNYTHVMAKDGAPFVCLHKCLYCVSKSIQYCSSLGYPFMCLRCKCISGAAKLTQDWTNSLTQTHKRKLTLSKPHQYLTCDHKVPQTSSYVCISQKGFVWISRGNLCGGVFAHCQCHGDSYHVELLVARALAPGDMLVRRGHGASSLTHLTRGGQWQAE